MCLYKHFYYRLQILKNWSFKLFTIITCWAVCLTPIRAFWKAGWKFRKDSLSPKERISKKGRSNSSPPYAQVTGSQALNKEKKVEVVPVLYLAMGNPAFDESCRLFTRLRGVKTAVIQLAEADAPRLLQIEKMKIGWVEYRIREHAEVTRCYRCLGYGHRSRGCRNPDRKDACWRCGATRHVVKDCKASPRFLTCLNRGKTDVTHVSRSGSCPVIR